jgi:hypothetical protein
MPRLTWGNAEAPGTAARKAIDLETTLFFKVDMMSKLKNIKHYYFYNQ